MSQQEGEVYSTDLQGSVLAVTPNTATLGLGTTVVPRVLEREFLFKNRPDQNIWPVVSGHLEQPFVRVM